MDPQERKCRIIAAAERRGLLIIGLTVDSRLLGCAGQ
jgi:hypothetical protein